MASIFPVYEDEDNFSYKLTRTNRSYLIASIRYNRLARLELAITTDEHVYKHADDVYRHEKTCTNLDLWKTFSMTA